MSAARREPPPISLPREFWERWNDTDTALGRVGHGLRLLEDWLCQTSASISVEDQNRIGFFVESALLFLENAQVCYQETGDAAKAAEGRNL